MKPKLAESAWAKLPKSEINACANWEFLREWQCRNGEDVESAWLELTAAEKVKPRDGLSFALFGRSRPAVFESSTLVFGAREIIKEGQRYVSAEIVEVGINWDESDTRIVSGFKDWLKKQRRKNPNARYFKGKKGGKKVDPLSVLVSIAMLRAKAARYSREQMASELMELAKRAAATNRFLEKYYAESIRAAENLFSDYNQETHSP